VQPGDVLVQCSDGLHGPVKSADIAEVVARTPDLKAAAAKLIDMANERDGGDNVSIQLIRVGAVERMGMYRDGLTSCANELFELFIGVGVPLLHSRGRKAAPPGKRRGQEAGAARKRWVGARECGAARKRAWVRARK